MGKELCEVCECEGETGVAEKHHIIPIEVTQQAGMPESQTLELCGNCHRELHRWYSTKVADMTYDASIKRFRVKSYGEMVQEYHSVFDSFVKYKKEQKKHVKKS